MVSFKKLFLAAPFLLQAISAAPTPPNADLSVRSNAQDAVVLEARGFENQVEDNFHLRDSLLDIRKKKTKTKDTSDPTKTQTQTSATSTVVSVTSTSATSTTGTATSASASATSTDGASCQIKREPKLLPRTLKPVSAKTNGIWQVDEKTYVPASRVSAGDKFTAGDVSGCTIVWFWNSQNIPSVFHIFSGEEKTEGPNAVEMLEELGSKVKPVKVTIAAMNPERYGIIKDAAKVTFDLDEGAFQDESYDNDKDKKKDERFEFDAVAGTFGVTRRTVKYCPREQ